MDAFDKPAASQVITSSQGNCSYFLFSRTKRLLGANGLLPAKINELTTYLIETGYQLGSDSQRRDIERQLCKTMAAHYRVWIPILLRNGVQASLVGKHHINNLQQACDIGDKVAAAVSLNDKQLVRELLPELEKHTLPLRSHVLGNPFSIAAVENTEDIIKLLTAWTEGLPKGDRRKVGFQFTDLDAAIIVAIQASNHPMLRNLIDLYAIKFSFPDKESYNYWLGEALSIADTKTINIILKTKVRRSMELTLRCFDVICKSGNCSLIKACLKKGLIDTNKPFPKREGFLQTYPVEVAVRCRRPKVLSTLLKAGALVDGRNQYAQEPGPPLQTAIRRSDICTVRGLLKQGARLRNPRWSDWDPLEQAYESRHRSIYDSVRETKMQREGVYIKTYDQRMGVSRV
jgi:hypothetical protein